MLAVFAYRQRLVTVASTDGSKPGSVVVSYIERGDGLPTCGDGPVFISHEAQKVDVKISDDFSSYPNHNPVDESILKDLRSKQAVASTTFWRNDDDIDGFWVRDEVNFIYYGTDGIYYGYCTSQRDSGYWYVVAYGIAYPTSHKFRLECSRIMNNSYGYNWNRLYPVSWSFESFFPDLCSKLNTIKHLGGYFDYCGLAYWVSGYTYHTRTCPINKGEYEYWNAHANYRMGISFSQCRISNGYFAEAFYQAIDKLPKLEQNTFANIIECISTLVSFKKGYKGFGSLKELAQDSWLAYRYSYNTTISDLREISSVAARLVNLPESMSSYGYAYHDNVAYHAAVRVSTSQFLPPNIKGWCNELNLKLTAANVWDMIPYSFVVDWFLPVSALLEALDDWVGIEELQIDSVWYSFVSSYADDPQTRAYGRWLGNPPALPHVSVSSVSGRTLWMRVADALSLFF